MTTTVANGIAQARDVAIQANGKIVTVGYALGQRYLEWALVRYQSDGSLDTSFGDGGKVLPPLGAREAYAQALAVQNDGKIVVVGFSEVVDAQGYKRVGTVLRFNSNGSLDPNFGTDGVVMLDQISVFNDVAIQSDGKIVAAGSDEENQIGGVQRLKSDGTGDSSFGTDGFVSVAFAPISTGSSSINSLALQTNGKIVVAGDINSLGGIDFGIARLKSNGDLDTTFDTDGLLRVSLGDDDSANAVAVQADGKIVAAGYADDGHGLCGASPEVGRHPRYQF